MIATAEWLVALCIVGFAVYSFVLFLANEWAKGMKEIRQMTAEKKARKAGR